MKYSENVFKANYIKNSKFKPRFVVINDENGIAISNHSKASLIQICA